MKTLTVKVFAESGGDQICQGRFNGQSGTLYVAKEWVMVVRNLRPLRLLSESGEVVSTGDVEVLQLTFKPKRAQPTQAPDPWEALLT